MIRILHYIGSLHYAGAQTFVMELYRNIDRTKVQFDFVVFPEEECGFYEEVKQYGAVIYKCPKYKILNHRVFVRWWKTFFTEHHEIYSVVHIHQPVTAKLVIQAVERICLPVIVHSHSQSGGTGVVAKIKGAMQHGLVHMCDYMYACSDEAGKYLFGPTVLEKSNYETLQNAIDISRFKFNMIVRKQLRKALNIDDNFVIGNVGRFYSTKNQMFLVNLMPKVHSIMPNAILLLVGDGAERDKLELRIRELDIADKVLLVGNRRNTEDYYQCMDLFAMPSLHEGFGIVALEAQTSGLHCLLSDAIPRSVNITGNAEFLELAEKPWLDAISKAASNNERTGCENTDDIYKAGFDSKALAKKVEMKYYELSKAEK